ncbi:MAG: DUF3761 domain-containing protein [Gaiellaceae bacterium]
MRRALALLLLGAVLGTAVVETANGNAPPPGATARCRDGSYSYSQHRSGTCSHHGGVAEWLGGASSASGGSQAGTKVSVGVSVPLAPRTRSSACRLGPDPDRRCSPGAYYSALTRSVVCSASFHTSQIRNVPDSLKHAVEQEYGLAARSYGRTLEVDHIVSLELGGSNDIANLFPELASADPGYRVKDRLENRLHALVCSGSISLRNAQTGIASDWQALYRRVFGTAPRD